MTFNDAEKQAASASGQLAKKDELDPFKRGPG
jgi:hypothetical protein